MKKTIAIIGSGPSALMLAAELESNFYEVTIYERNATPGIKLLVAGNGGFNLTHSESLDQFITRYKPAGFLDKTILSFSNEDLRDWLKRNNIPTYIGSSNRVFPEKTIKPKQVLNTFLKILSDKQVKIKHQFLWKGWDGNSLIFEHFQERIKITADIVVFALGGSSWGKTGSDGSWIGLFKEKGIKTIPFQPSNCAYQIKWDESFISHSEGKSLKNITIKCSGAEKKGEVVVTTFGLEGGAIYALSPEIREQLNENNKATIFIDLKPTLTSSEIRGRLERNKKKLSWTKHVENELKLTKTQMALLKSHVNKDDFMNKDILFEKIKNFPLQILSMAPIDEAISTVGGIATDEIDHNYQFNKIPGQYAIGEMLDWDAPTGGYLLQACFSMGKKLATYLNRKHGK